MSVSDDGREAEYALSDWAEIVASASFGELPDDQVLLLYRHWLWADYSREVYQHELETWMYEPVGFDSMLGRDLWAIFVWCGLLYVVIEGLTQRKVLLGGRLKQDIRRTRKRLNAARNATFHVGSQEGSWDERLSEIWGETDDDADAYGRVHMALGRLLRAELARRPLPSHMRDVIGLDNPH